MKKVFFLALFLISGSLSAQNAQRISIPGFNYIDPEIFSEENKLAFQTGNGSVWLADLDPITGSFVSANGLDLLIDTGASSLIQSFNGPEFGFDTLGWAIFYTKNNGPAPQAWKAEVENGIVTNTPLTSGNKARLSILSSKSSSSESIRILFSKGASLNTGVFGWTDEEDPAAETIIDSTDRGVRWIDDTRKFIYIKQTGIQDGQLFLYDTETSTQEQITNDATGKSYAYGWIAPEYDELITLVLEGDTAIAIYRDLGNEYWDRIITIAAPEESSFKNIGSPETFTAGGKSYISFVTKVDSTGSAYDHSEVWLSDIDPDPENRLTLRCDDGSPGVIRSDPESYLGEDEVFIYYNRITEEGIYEIWRYATGIPAKIEVGNEKIPVLGQDKIYPNPVNDYLTISCPQGYQIVNTSGQIVMKSNLPSEKINVSGLNPGIYILCQPGRSERFIKGF